MASIVAQAGFLVTISRYKEWVFFLTAIFLGLAFYLAYRPAIKECPPGSVCEVTRPHTRGRLHRVMLWISTAGFLLALFLSYFLVPLLDLVSYW